MKKGISKHELNLAKFDFQDKEPDDLQAFFVCDKPQYSQIMLRAFVRYMVFLENNVSEKIESLYRMQVISEQNLTLVEAKLLFEYIGKEITYWKEKQKRETEPTKTNTDSLENDSAPIKIRWAGSVTQLATMFYGLHKKHTIDNSKADLQRWILYNFVDKQGKPFNQSTLETLFKVGNEDKRAKVGKEFEPENLFSVEPE